VVDRATRPLDRAELESLRATASRLVGGKLLDGLPRGRLGIARVSDAIRVNRVQGLTLGLGVAQRFGGRLEELGGTSALGTADGRLNVTGRAAFRLGSARLRLEGGREVRDLAGEPVISPLLNSLLAQELGRDYGDYVLVEGVAARVRAPSGNRAWLEAGLARERATSVATAARPVWGRYDANPPLGGPPAWTARLSLGRRPAGGLTRRDLDGKLELEAGSDTARWARLAVSLGASIPVLKGSLRTGGRLGLGSSALPLRRSFVLGGRGTLPGEQFRGFGGRRAVLVSVEWQHEVPGPALSLGPFGSTGASAVVGPFLAAGWADRSFPGLPWGPSGGVHPVAGVALELFAQSLRIEVAQALRGRRGPGVVIDVARAWWPIL